MRFKLPANTDTFEIRDNWWRFAEMEGFQPGPGGHYPYRCGTGMTWTSCLSPTGAASTQSRGTHA